jgi:hypothetical protein
VFTPTTIVNLRGGVVRSAAFSGNEVDADTSGWKLPSEVINLLGTNMNRAPNISTSAHLFALRRGNVNDAHTSSAAVQKLFGTHMLKLSIAATIRTYHGRQVFTSYRAALSADRFAESERQRFEIFNLFHHANLGSPKYDLHVNSLWAHHQRR